MFVIAGATGHTGSVAAETLLGQGRPVTVLVRDPRKAEYLREQGARVATCSMDDPKGLTAAFTGAEGAYFLIPPNLTAPDLLGYGSKIAGALAQAVKSSGIPHAVLLSSVGAQHAEGTGPIRSLHQAEAGIGPVSKNVTFLRAGYFLQNWANGIDAVRNQGVLHNFLTPGRKIPMVSTEDIGRIAAGYLTDPARGRRVVELAGPEDYSPEDIAQAFSTVLGKPVKLETHPLDAAIPVLTNMGFSQDVARLFREMIEGINSGRVTFEGKGAIFERGKITAQEAVRQLLGITARSGSRAL
jgi:uncharacterized protein YbjT (DUF2867 family)